MGTKVYRVRLRSAIPHAWWYSQLAGKDLLVLQTKDRDLVAIRGLEDRETSNYFKATDGTGIVHVNHCEVIEAVI